VLDYAIEVPAYPDRLVPYAAPPDDDLALEAAATPSSYGGLVAAAENRAAAIGAGRGSRLLVPEADLAGALRDALLVPLVIGGSAVLVRNEDPSKREARVAAERAGVLVA
jgi:hypothetical protein